MVFSRFTKVFVVCAVIAIGVYGGYWYYANIYAAHADTTTQYQTSYESDPSVRFDMEAWDLIMQNYWQKPTPDGLAQYFQLSVEKAADISTTTVAATDRASTAAMLASVFDTATSSTEKQQWAVNTLVVLMYNLAPTSRNELLTSAAQTQLAQEVTNTNPATGQVEPTVFSHILGNTLYLYISKMSPTTLDEFQNAIANASSTPGLDSMIIDLRGNIGGSLPDAASLLGYFIGNNQYAFDLYQQGNLNVVRTTTDAIPALSRYRDIAVLTDDMTQSTAEVITAAFERFHLGHVVGATTRGWGTVENEYPLTTQISSSTSYALLLVEYVTLRPDQTPIQSVGVTPDVAISDPDWRSELSTYFRSPSLIAALKQEADSTPLQ